MKRKTLIIVLIFLVLIIGIALKIYIDKTTFNFYGTIVEISDIGVLNGTIKRVMMNVQPKTENRDEWICGVYVGGVKILDKNGKKIDISDLKIGDKIVVTTKSEIINYTNPPSLNQVKRIKVLKDN